MLISSVVPKDDTEARADPRLLESSMETLKMLEAADKTLAFEELEKASLIFSCIDS